MAPVLGLHPPLAASAWTCTSAIAAAAPSRLHWRLHPAAETRPRFCTGARRALPQRQPDCYVRRGNSRSPTTQRNDLSYASGGPLKSVALKAGATSPTRSRCGAGAWMRTCAEYSAEALVKRGRAAGTSSADRRCKCRTAPRLAAVDLARRRRRPGPLTRHLRRAPGRRRAAARPRLREERCVAGEQVGRREVLRWEGLGGFIYERARAAAPAGTARIARLLQPPGRWRHWPDHR